MSDSVNQTIEAVYRIIEPKISLWLVTKFVVFLVLILLALGGNVLVCVAICWDRQLRRQRDNLFLVSLAVSDLLVSVLVMVFAAANDLQHRWSFGRLYCKLWISFDIMCCTCSILNLCAVALDRYSHISRPMVYLRYMNRRRICLIILCVWVLSAGIGFTQLTFEVDRPDDVSLSPDALTSARANPVCSLELEPFYAIVSSTLSFFLPAALMVLLYTRLYLYARTHVRHIRRQQFSACMQLVAHCEQMRSFSIHATAAGTAAGDARLTRSSTTDGDTPLAADKLQLPNHRAEPPTAATGKQARANQTKKKKRLPGSNMFRLTTPIPSPSPSFNGVQQLNSRPLGTKTPAANRGANDSRAASEHKARVTLGVIMGTFLLCWAPFFIVNVLRPFLGAAVISPSLFQSVTWLGYANSTANPIIYSIFNRDFRRAFHRVLTYCCRLGADDLATSGGGGGSGGKRRMYVAANSGRRWRRKGERQDDSSSQPPQVSSHQPPPSPAPQRPRAETRVVQQHSAEGQTETLLCRRILNEDGDETGEPKKTVVFNSGDSAVVLSSVYAV